MASAALGCGPSLKELEIRQADQAKARGDYVMAAEHLNRACALDPKDGKVCAEAKSIAVYAVRESIAAAEREIAAGQYAEAISRLVKARNVDHEGKVGPVLDRVGDKVATQCESHPVETVVDAIRFVRCLETHRIAIDRPSFSARVDAGRNRAGAVTSRIAAESATLDRQGSAYAQYSVAQCLSGNAAIEASKNQHYARFYERISVPVAMSVRMPWTSPAITQAAFCAAVQKRSPIVTCQGTLGARTLGVDLTVSTSRPTHDVTAVQREIEYVDHIETYNNPEYGPLASQVAMERRSIQRERAMLERAKADCDTANSAWRRANCNECAEHTTRDATCNRADAARTSFDAHERDVNQLERSLSNTPQTLQREVRDIFRYTENTHKYAQAFHLLGSTTSEGRVAPSDHDDSVEYTVVEHVGFLKAGLAPSPLVVPSTAQFRQEITGRAHVFAENMAAADLATRAATKLSQCPNPRDPAQLDCWLEAQMLTMPDPVVAYTQMLSEDVGKTFPPAGCK